MSEADQAKTKRFSWTRVLLILSLCLNMLVIGAMAAFFSSNPGAREIGRRPPPDGPFLYIRAFSKEDRRALGRDFLRNSKKAPKDRQQWLTDYQDAIDVIQQEPFDPVALSAVLNRQQDRSKSLRERGRDTMVDYLSNKTPEERAAYAERLAEELLEFRSRGKKGDRN